MKKLSMYLLGLVALAGVATSCGPDEDPTATLPEPDGTVAIEFTNIPGNNPILSVASGDVVTVNVRMTKGTGTRPQKLRIYETTTLGTRGTQVKIDGQGNPNGTIDLRNLDVQDKTVNYPVSQTSGTLYLYFEVDESNGKFSRKVLQLNIGGTGSIAEWNDRVLGAQTNAAGSRISSATGTIYTVCDLEENINFVDITYAAIGSPTALPTLLSNPRRATQDLSTTGTCAASGGSINTGGGRAAYFATTSLTAADFTSATDATLNGLTVSSASSQQITVEDGDVIAFLNADGKKGLIYVDAVTSGTAGSITLDIKVQR